MNVQNSLYNLFAGVRSNILKLFFDDDFCSSEQFLQN